MGIGAGAIEAGNAGIQAVICDHLTDSVHQLCIEGSSHHILGGEGCCFCGLAFHSHKAATEERNCQTLRTVFITGAGSIDGSDGLSPVEAVCHRDQLSHGEVLQELIPRRIVIVLCSLNAVLILVHLEHIIKGQAVGSLQNGHILPLSRILIEVSADFAPAVDSQLVNHLFDDVQLDVLTPRATPVESGEEGNNALTVVQIGICVIQLIGDLGTVERLGVGLAVEFHIPAVNQLCLAVCVHTVIGGLGMGSQNVIDRIVGIGSRSQVISACVQNIGLCAVGVIGSHIALVDLNGQSLRSAGLQNRGLTKANQLHSRLFDHIVNVVLGVGRGQIDLHSLLTCHITGVGNYQSYIVALFAIFIHALLHRHIAVDEAGIGKAMAEGKGHFLAILLGIITGIALTHNCVKVSGLVVLVAYIDTFLIDHIGRSLLRHLTVIVTILKGNVVMHCRRGKVIVAVGIYQAAGGVDLTCQNVGHCVGTADTQTADPQTSIHIIVIQEIHLKRIGGVDQNDDAGDSAFLLEVIGISHQSSFIVVERKVIKLAGNTVTVHIAGECAIVALAADTGEGNDHCVIIGSDGVLYISGIVGRIDLRDGCLTTQRSIFAAGAAFCGFLHQFRSFFAVIPVPQYGVYLKAALFQRCFQVISLGSIHITGAGTAVGQIHRVNGQCGNLCALPQGQCAVVEQQSRAFGFYFVAQILTGLQSLLLRNAHTGIVDRAIVSVLQLPEAVACQKQRYGVVEHTENDVQGDHDGRQDRAEQRNGLPKAHIFPLCLFVSFFRLLILGFLFVHGFSSFINDFRFMTPVGVNLTNINFNIPRPFGQHQIDYILRIYRCNICTKTQTIPKTPFSLKDPQ